MRRLQITLVSLHRRVGAREVALNPFGTPPVLGGRISRRISRTKKTTENSQERLARRLKKSVPKFRDKNETPGGIFERFETPVPSAEPQCDSMPATDGRPQLRPSTQLRRSNGSSSPAARESRTGANRNRVGLSQMKERLARRLKKSVPKFRDKNEPPGVSLKGCETPVASAEPQCASVPAPLDIAADKQRCLRDHPA